MWVQEEFNQIKNNPIVIQSLNNDSLKRAKTKTKVWL